MEKLEAVTRKQWEESRKFSEISKLNDGFIDIIDDLIVLKVGISTFHPLKSVKGFLTDSDIILVSRLFQPPSSTAIKAVKDAIQKVLIRPLGNFYGQGMPLGSSRLQCTVAQAYSQRVDSTLLVPLSLGKARTVLSQISHATSLPVMIPIDPTSGCTEYCYFGQQNHGSGVYETFKVKAQPFSAFQEQTAVEDFWTQFREEMPTCMRAEDVQGETKFLISAVYDMFLGSSERDRSFESQSCAQLITEWVLNEKDLEDAKGPRNPPPSVCSSALIVSPPSGSLSSAGVKFRSILTRLTDLWDEYELQEDEQGFEDSGEQPTENITLILSNLQQGTWQAELQELLESTKSHTLQTIGSQTTKDNEAADAADATLTILSSEDMTLEEDGRKDLDFTEQLWTVLACTHTMLEVAAVLTEVFEALRNGIIFPVISCSNATQLGIHLREGLRLAQATRYGNLLGGSKGLQSWEEWLSQGGQLAKSALTAVEIGIHKLRRDLSYWFESEVVVSESELSWFLNVGDPAEKVQYSPQMVPVSLQRLTQLIGILDLVSLARSCGAPWQALQSLGHTALQQNRNNPPAESLQPCPVPFFLVSLPSCLPPQVRSQLSDPLQWTFHTAFNPKFKNLNPSLSQQSTFQESFFLTCSKSFAPSECKTTLQLSPKILQFAQQALGSIDSKLHPEVWCLLWNLKTLKDS